MAGTQEVIPQENIADTGSDIGNGVPGNAPLQQPIEQNPQAMNGGFVDPMAGMVDPGTTAQLVIEKEKFKKVFEKYEDLINYNDVFLENLKFVNTGLLDDFQFSKFQMYLKNVKELKNKMENYLENIFNSEAYEKVVYNYVLFRTEMITNIKGLRDVLDLNKPED